MAPKMSAQITPQTEMAESVVSFATRYIESKINEGSKASFKIKNDANALLLVMKTANGLLLRPQEGTELSSNYELRSWFKELRKIAYEAEDEVDELVSSSSSALPFLRLGSHRDLKKLRGLMERATEVKTKLWEHAKRSNGSKKELMSRARGSQAPKVHLPAADDFVIGIDGDISKVVDLLTGKSESNDSQPLVNNLAIVGMGGSGKTTFARSIYNHNAVIKSYDFRAWVSVSQGWDMSVVLRSILKQNQGQSFGVENSEPKMLVSQLNDLLSKKTCLLVLDDVWDMEPLHEFIKQIRQTDNESPTYTIIITSRKSPGNLINWYIHQPQSLTNEDCWKLFSTVASKTPVALSVEYRPIAMEMLKKCQGLPLAIVALGRLLKTKDPTREWQRVLYQIEGAEGTSMYGPVNEILGLSYDQLPFHLKPCFLYLGLFPEGSTISGGTLIRMWIAEGFIKCNESENDNKIEVAGRRYLQELIDHNMVQIVRKTYSGKAKRIRIHDIMRDFCILKAKDLDFLAVPSFGTEAIEKTSRRVGINLSKSLELPANSPHLRSLALYGQSNTSEVPEGYSNQVSQRYINLAGVCQMYKLVRVLDIVGIQSPDGTLPKEIGKLIHLTYLRVRSTNIRELPESIGKLSNLLTLDYWDVLVDSEVKVPDVLWKLQKLRHLYLPNEMGGSVEALKLHTLKHLITLWGIGGGNWMLKEMGQLSSTLGKLYIHRISTNNQINAVLDTLAKTENNNNCLYALALDWYGFEITNLNALCSKQNLQKLRLIGGAPDNSYPNGFPFPYSLRKLELYYTKLAKQETMSLLGTLAFLKVLRLSKNAFAGSEWRCSKEQFPVLEELKLSDLPELEKWEMEAGTMRCLKKLSIVFCIKLKQMPIGLKSIGSLEKLEIERMPSSFMNKLLKADERKARGGEDVHIIMHIPQVVIRNSCGTVF